MADAVRAMLRVPCTFSLAAVLVAAAFGGNARAADTSAAALPQLRIDDVRRFEGNSGQTTFAFTVTLSPRSTERVQINYATLNSTATGGGVDFWSVNGTLFIEPGQVTGTIPVLVKGDLEDEPDERFSVRLSSPIGATLADFIGEGTIVNDDAPGVHLLEPNGGEVLHTGDPGWIRWRTSGPGDSAMALSLWLSLDGSGRFDAIATRLPNTGAFLWDPVAFSTGGDDDPVFSAVLKIEAALPSGRTATDVSDAPFAIHDDPARIATLTRLEVEPAQPVCLEGVTLRASVSPASATGVIDFLDGGGVLDSVALDSSGTALVAISPFAAGAHEVVALYRGDRIHRSSRSRALVDVERTPTQASLDTPASPTCTEVRLVLEVMPTAASGLARFRDGGTWVGDATLTDGRATLVAAGLDVGPHAFTAEYEGNGCFLPSASDTLRARVLNVPSTVAMSSDVNPALAGERVVFTAAITPGGTGAEIEFFDGGTPLGRAPVVGGVATLNATLGDTGEHLITAAFAGDACRMPSESPPYVQRVAAEPELSIGPASAPEGSCGSHTLPFTVRLSIASPAVVTVRFTTADGTATAADSDYLPASGQVRFAPRETSKEIFVTILEDLRDEGDEDLRVTLFEPTAAAIGDGTAEGGIVDDDAPWPEDPPRFIQQWGEPGSGPAQFHAPLRAAVRDDNELWIGDTDNGRIQIFSLKGAFKRIWPGNVGPLEGFGFDSTHVFTGAGESIIQWNAAGAPLRVWGGFVHVRGLSLDSYGDVFVADGGGFVHHFDHDGGFVHKWSAPLPLGIAIGPDNEVLMTSGDGRLHSYTREGFPAAGAPTDACFEQPAGAAVDRTGNLYVADTDHHRIQKFRRDGSFLTMWGSEGSLPGQFRRPTGIAVDSSGNVYVVDSGNHRIQKFGAPDRNAPIVFCPPDTTVACGSAGVVLAFSPAGAEDDQDPGPRVECVPISGSFFPAGTTRVVCTATDQTGNASSCHFDVTVRSEPCGEKSLVRIDEVALGCANGDTIQFIELNAAGDGQQCSGGLLLRVHDRADRLVLERANLFPTRMEGESWPAERRWLIGTESLASAAMDPDLTIPALLDPLGGRITILAPGNAGYEVVDEVAYGMVGGSDAPLPGHSLQRQADGSTAPKPTPDPTRFDGGSANGLRCPCPMNVISYCEGQLSSTEPFLSGGGTCRFIGGATGSSSGRYDLRSGSLEAFGSGNDCVDHHNGGRATVQVSDVYCVTGVPAGTPLSFHVVFRLQIASSSCPSPRGGTGWASGTIAAGDAVLSAQTGNGSSLDTTLRAPMAVPSNQPFRVSLKCEAAGAVGGSGGATGRLSFSGLPPGARMTSCQGFVGDVAVPVQASIEAIEVQSDFVRLQWYLPAVTSPVGVERAHEGDPWMRLREDRPRQDRVEFTDRDVVAGTKYGYRLAWQDGGFTRFSPASWVSIPVDRLSLEAPVPNPTSGQMILRFDLRAGLPAAIDLVDIAGRRMFEQDFRGYAAGRHELAVPSSLALAPGLYFVRLSQGDERRTRRVLVAR